MTPEVLAAISALDGEVILAGVRHHSPACARAIRDLLRARRPTTILIEGPDDVTDLAPLQDPALKAPVALFSYVAYPSPDGRLAGRRRSAGWYPFCDYSPELVAIREAASLSTPVSFCDLGLHARLCVQAGLSERLQSAERDLFEAPVSHNAFHQRLLEKVGARDADDLWDQLFELGGRDMETVLRDIAAYGLALRSSSGPEEVIRSGDAAREAHMAAAVKRALSDNGGPVVLVCGAYHLAGVHAALRDGTPPPTIKPLPRGTHTGAHLVPYDFRRMRRLRYAAGMSQPAWYQADWEATEGGEPAWLQMLSSAASRVRRISDVPISTADLEGAAEQARRLAGFRGHRTPSRVDVLDAATSCWVKGAADSGHGRLVALLDEAFSGDRIGSVGPQAGDPPLVRDVDAQLSSLSLEAPSGRRRDVRLRPVRAARDRQRSQALARLDYLKVPYGRLLRGPDLVEGINLDRVEQVWDIGWETESRSALFERSAYGATLADAAAERLREDITATPPRAEASVRHLIAACAMGLQALLRPLLDMVTERLESDQMLSSILKALHGLVLLYRYRDAIGGVGLSALAPLLARCGERATWLLSSLPETPAERETDAIEGLIALEHAAAILEPGLLDPDALLSALSAVRPRLPVVPGVAGAADAVLWRAGVLDDAPLSQAIRNRFAEAAGEGDTPGRYLGGLMAVARRAYLDHTGLITAAGEGLVQLSEEDFRRALPRLRREHTALSPGESARLSRRIASLWGPDPASVGPMSLSLPAAAEQLDQLNEIACSAGVLLAEWGLTLPTPAAPEAAPVPVPVPVSPSGEWLGDEPELLRRWRLVLGQYAASLPPLSGGQDGELDGTLGYLYDREYGAAGREQRDRVGGRGASELTVPDWINRLEVLFPRETYERLEAEALDRYGLEELVTDAEVLSRCEPSMSLLEAVLRLKHKMRPAVLDAARRVVAAVVAQLQPMLLQEARDALGGRSRRQRPSPRGPARSFDPRETVRRNLRHYDPVAGRLTIERPWFTRHVRSYTDWRIVVCVDQSGSMLSSTIHAGVVASVFASIPEVSTHLVVFDTAVVDLTDQCRDPVETLLSIQLGGGTNIAQALGYCAGLVEQPRKTLVVLITDLYEGGDAELLVARAQRLIEGGSRLLILAALDESGQPDYDHVLGQRMVQLGAEVGAMSPRALVRWIGSVLG
ncbi:MAG: hypothetical protein ACI8S6_001084 [Myxococcota bacterium]